jgi:heat-inducible transcriptional repressor
MRAMNNLPVTELSIRARGVFRLVVETYLQSGQPVGSRTLSKLSVLGLSPASIRNVMQDLEEAGLLASPHTSAGRLPTESGLRLFVDGMMQASEPTADERAQIENQIYSGGPIEDALAAVSATLSGLSACAGVVVVPKHEPVIRELAFVPLSPGRALAVLVGADGSLENRVVNVPLSLPVTALAEIGRYVTVRLAGLTLSEAEARLRAEIEAGRATLDRVAGVLVAKGLAVWSQDSASRPVMIVRGQANLLDVNAAADLERVRQLLDELEDKAEIARLLDSARSGEGCKIFIGSENKLFSLSGSSVIAAPYRGGDGQVVGVVGVIGPTRLNYARIVPMVDFTAQALTRLMQ